MFSPYSPDALASWCVAIKHGHGAGLPLTRVFDTLARSGPRRLRTAAGDIRDSLEKGTSLDEAVRLFVPSAPPVFLAMAVVADQSGHVPEVFGELEAYFREQEKLERQFRSQAAWPVIQFVAAIVILSLVVIVLGFLGPQAEAVFGNGPIRMVFALIAIGLLAGAGFGVFKYLKSSAERQAKLGQFLLRVPSLGGCLTSLAMSRFCLAMKLTMDSTLPVERAVRLSLEATGLEAFAEQSKRIAKMIKNGADLSTAIGANPIFPKEFLAFISVAEVSGQVPEVMARQAEHYREEASRRFSRLTKQLNIALAALVGVCLIAAIFTVFGAYANALNTGLEG